MHAFMRFNLKSYDMTALLALEHGFMRGSLCVLFEIKYVNLHSDSCKT